MAPLLPPAEKLPADEWARARFLAVGGVIVLIAGLTLLPQLIVEQAADYLWWVAGITFAGSATVILFVRAARVLLAGHVFAFACLAIGTLLVTIEGVEGSRSLILAISVIMAGFLLQPLMAMAYALAAAAVIAAVHYAGELGWLGPFTPQAEGQWLTSIRLLLIAGVLVTLLAGGLRQSILRLRERERELESHLEALQAAREAERLARERLASVQRLEALGRLAGGVAHDFNNLLTVILSNVALAELEHPGDHSLEQIGDAAQRGVRISQQLLDLGKLNPGAPQRIGLNESIRSLSPMLERLVGRKVRVDSNLEATADVLVADRGRLDQILLNLAVNAQQAMPDGGTLRLATANASPDGQSQAGWVRLTVADSGVGMSPQVRDRIFEPFFTTRPPGEGTGIGLAIVHGAVAEMGGSIAVDSEPGRGTRFDVYLPTAEPA